MGSASIASVFTNALGASPSDVGKAARLGKAEVESLRAWYTDWVSNARAVTHAPDELWPLISHHNDVDSNVVLRNFIVREAASGGAKNPIDELKAHLIACTGVVLADPLRRVFFTVEGQPIAEPRGDHLIRIAGRIGDLSPLLDNGIIEISHVHPNLADNARQRFITPFHLGPNMRTVTDLIEEGYWPHQHPDEQARYPLKVGALMEACGVRDQDLPPAIGPRQAVEQFARTLMEVSWQLAAVTETGADLYLTNALERRVFEVLLEDSIDTLRALGHIAEKPDAEGRHVQQLATIGLPSLDARKVSYADLVEVRSGVAFSDFRATLTRALDTYVVMRDSRGDRTAVAAFNDEISYAAGMLNGRAKDKSLRKLMVDNGRTMPFVITAAGGVEWIHTGSVLATMVAAGVPFAAEKLCSYVFNRQRKDARAALRIIAAFQSGPPTRGVGRR